jgi:hypothetical protein
MPYATVTASRPPREGSKTPEKKLTSSSAILAGLSRLLVGQKRFAEELGVPYTRVFAEECQVFRNKEPDMILRDWLRDKTEGPQKFKQLINDLVEHNLALHAALDGVALESISRLSPKAVKAESFSIFGWKPFAWLRFRRLHRAYATNDYLRHQELVVNGFTKAYCAQRETLRASKPRLYNVSNPQTRKEHHDS